MAYDKKKRTRLNKAITASQVRLIEVNGEQIGIVSNQEALEKAQKAQLDLVEIVPQANPPVCRIMDHGKYLFEQNKKRNKAKKKQKRIQVKEVKFRPNTEEGDYQVKLRNLIRFLDDGDKTKVTLRFRGREMAHQNLGRQLLKRLELDLTEYGTVEQRPKMEGRQMVMVIAPIKKNPDKI
ncbi:MAG: translation initiation factor IF-3 [Thiomargarita sp.]|nr:translation initiation factor IF-3 [Thiomargarita sp.]